jgi:hypothetical protein
MLEIHPDLIFIPSFHALAHVSRAHSKYHLSFTFATSPTQTVESYIAWNYEYQFQMKYVFISIQELNDDRFVTNF